VARERSPLKLMAFWYWSTHFYRAMLCIRCTSHGPMSVCLSSQVGVLLKRLNVGSHKQHRTIARDSSPPEAHGIFVPDHTFLRCPGACSGSRSDRSDCRQRRTFDNAAILSVNDQTALVSPTLRCYAISYKFIHLIGAFWCSVA